MKYILLLLVSIRSFAQPVTVDDETLYTLGKVWGIMKYYHPAVSQGKIDWDSVLIETLERKNDYNGNEIITKWFEIADKTPFEVIEAAKCQYDSITLRNFSASWIQQSTHINSNNKAKLLELVTHPNNIGFFYSNPGKNSIRLNSKNEKVYISSSSATKILELFRVWNAIEYFYPYKYLLDTNWDNVLKKYITVFKSITNERTYEYAIMQLTAEIQDTHTSLKESYQYNLFGKLSSPFTFQIVDTVAIVTSIKDPQKTKESGINIGDCISRVNGKFIREIIAEKGKLFPASNTAVIKRECYNYLFSGADSICSIEGSRENGEHFQTSFKRVERVFNNEWDKDGIPDYHLIYKGRAYDYLVWNNDQSRLNPGFRLDDKAYIEFSSLRLEDIDSLMQAYHDTKGLVFDLRGYNDDGNLLKTFDYLFSKPTLFGIKTLPAFNLPGKFYFEDNIINKEYKYVGKENPNAYKGQVIVLINEYTQSAEEMWAMIFKQIPGVIFIGSQTAGADGNITAIKLTNGNELRFSGLGIYYPDGAETQRIGIQPDILLRPSIENIRSKEDVLLEKAFYIIDNKN